MNMITIITKKGLVIKFDAKDVRMKSRGGKGIRAVNLNTDDEVVAAFSLQEEN